jgi:hypothetical protein
MNLTPGVEIFAHSYSPFDQNITLQIDTNKQPVVIGSAISKRIFIELLTEQPQKLESINE